MSLAKTCLDEANITNRAVVFRQVPKTTFAVYFETVDTSESADFKNNVKNIDSTIELYEYLPDEESRTALENALDNHNLKWRKDDTVWLVEEQMYETIYSFSHIERSR